MAFTLDGYAWPAWERPDTHGAERLNPSPQPIASNHLHGLEQEQPRLFPLALHGALAAAHQPGNLCHITKPRQARAARCTAG